MSLSLDNITTGDGYTTGSEVSWQQADTLELVVANAAVRAQFRPYDPDRQNLLPWGDERLLTPGARTYSGIAGVRVRSAVPGTPAQVVADLLGPGDPRPASSAAAFDLHLAPDGSVSQTIALKTGDFFESASGGDRDGAVLADGAHYDSVTDSSFVNLYNQIGITYGGTGPSDFAVPDRRDRVSVGAGGNTAAGDNDGIAAADRHGTRHQHTEHVHASSKLAGGSGVEGTGAQGNQHYVNTLAADGGSGVSTDPLDGPAFLGVYVYIVK